MSAISLELEMNFAEERMCSQIKEKTEYLESVVEQFRGENSAKALAFICYLEAAAHEFIDDDLARQFEV